MPILSEEMARELLERALSAAHILTEPGRIQHYCGASVMDYCRTCDEFYWVHPASGCATGQHRGEEHSGHRLTIVPFVEERGL